MGANSKIEWCHHTFNPWRGCTKVSEGCKHCYAETLSKRNPKALGMWGPQGERVVAADSYWKQPLKWNKWAEAGTCPACGGWGYDHARSTKTDDVTPCDVCTGTGRNPDGSYRARVFCASMADVFEDWQGPMCASNGVQMWRRESGEWTTSDHYRDTVALTMADVRHRLFDLILETPQLDWLLLTKRPENIIPALKAIPVLKRNNLWDHMWIGSDGQAWQRHFPNVWLGTSVEDQKAADTRIPEMLKVPAKVRFLSCEPLLGPVQITNVSGWAHPDNASWWGEPILGPKGIHWVIAGGESGPNARPMHPDWARSLRDQCQSAGVAFHFKQFGEWGPKPDGADIAPGDVMVDAGGHPDYPGDSFVRKCDIIRKLGKAAAGRLLDGRTWDEVPS